MGALTNSVGLLFKITAEDKASAVFKDVKESASSNSKSIQKDLENIGGTADGVGSVNTELGGLGEGLEGIAGPAGIAVGAITAAATAAAALAAGAVALTKELFDLAKSSAEYSDNIGDASDKTGLSVEALSALKFQADVSGESFDKLLSGVEKFTSTVAKAAEGSQQAKDKLTRLGVDPQAAIKDLDGTFSGLLKRIVDIKNPTEQGAAATDLFGEKLGKNLLPLLKDFDGDLPALITKAKSLGAVLTDEDAKAAGDFEKATGTLKAQINVLGVQIGKEFIPTFIDLAKRFSAFLADNKDGIVQFGKSAAVVFGDVIKLLTTLSEKAKEYQDFLRGIIKVQETLDPLAGRAFRYAEDVRFRTNIQTGGSASGLEEPKKPQVDPDEYLQDLKAQREADKQREKERAAQEKADLGARITLLKNHLKEAETEYDRTLKSLRDKFKDAPDPEAFTLAYKQAAQQFAASAAGIVKPLESLQNEQAAKEKKTAGELLLLQDEQNKARTTAYSKILDETTKNEQLITESQKKESDKRVKTTEEATKQEIALDKAKSEKRIAQAETQGIQLGLKESETQAAIGKARQDAITDEIGDYQKLLQTAELSGDKRAEIENKVAVLRQTLATEEQKTAGAVSKAIQDESKRASDEADKALQFLERLRDEVNRTEQDLDNFRKAQERKVLVNVADYSRGESRIEALTKLRDFDLAENERQRKTEADQAQRAHDLALGKIKDKEKERDLVEQINKLLQDQLNLINAEHDDAGTQITNQANPKINNEKKANSGIFGQLAGIFGGLGGQGPGDKGAQGQIKSQADYIKGVYGDLADSANGAVGSMIGGLANLAVQWVTTGKFSVRAAAAMVAGILANFAIEAGFKALFQVAEGYASLAVYDFVGASNHFAAAGVYATAAGIAGGAAIAVGVASRIGADKTSPATASATSGNSLSSGSSGTSSLDEQERTITEGRGSRAGDPPKVFVFQFPKGVASKEIHDEINSLGPLRNVIIKLVEQNS